MNDENLANSCCQAATLAEARQYPLAEALYLRAKRPEAALQMYRAAGQLQAALRLAEAYLPNKAKELHLELAANMGSNLGAGGSGSLERLIGQARAFEKGNDYARAIEVYLSAHADDSSNVAALEQCWMQVGDVGKKSGDPGGMCCSISEGRPGTVLLLAAVIGLEAPPPPQKSVSL